MRAVRRALAAFWRGKSAARRVLGVEPVVISGDRPCEHRRLSLRSLVSRTFNAAYWVLHTLSGVQGRDERAGDYLISGPHWKGAVPEGVIKIVSPNNSVLLIGRVLVEGDGDLSTAYNLAKQIQLVPLTIRQLSQ